MKASDEFPGLLALAEMFPDRAGGEQAARALAEIDRLRLRDGAYEHVAELLTDALADNERLAAENAALVARRDEVMRASGSRIEELQRLVTQNAAAVRAIGGDS